MANTTPKRIYNVDEELSGIRNGVNTIFTTSTNFLITSDSTLVIFKSGVKQKQDKNYYIIDSHTVIIPRAPRPFEYLTCNYLPDIGVQL